MMIRPVRFGYNAQTAVNNAFQSVPGQEDPMHIQQAALNAFDELVEALRDKEIDVLVVSDTVEPHTPDSIFPNNWISFHEDGTLVLYPMFAENRRLERKAGVLDQIHKAFSVRKVIDYTAEEETGRFLEGTGSMVLDRTQRIAYACRSPRTDEGLLHKCCSELGYRPVVFDAYDTHGTPVYHTNVMMTIADRYTVICLECVSAADRPGLVQTLEKSGKTIVPITMQQMAAYAGNLLQVESREGVRYLVLSSQAFDAFDESQQALLETFNPIIHVPLDTIERYGGGSARCMMAEVFLPLKSEST